MLTTLKVFVFWRDTDNKYVVRAVYTEEDTGYCRINDVWQADSMAEATGYANAIREKMRGPIWDQLS